MAYIMKFLINLLLFNRRMFKNLINDVIKSYLLKQQNKLAIQSNGILYRIDTHNPFMCDLNNLNLDYLALGVHNKIILPTFQYNKHNGIIKDSICFFSKKSNDGFDGDEKDIESLLKSHESLLNNLQTIIAKLETLNANLDPKEINEIKETLMTCIQILQSNTGKDKNIEELINQEIKQCRFVRKETMEFIEEISRYLKQIDSGSKLEEQDQQSTIYFSGHDKFVDKKSTEPKSGDENDIVNTPLVLKRPIKPATVNKSTILDSKKNPVGYYKGTKVAHISEHDIKLNEYKLSDSIIQFKNGDIILERMISDRKMRKPQNHGDQDPKLSNINKSSTAVIPITANSEIMEIVPPFETFEILQGKIQQYPGANIKALQVIEQPNDTKSFELDDGIVKKLDHTILFEKNCNDLVGMLQVCCNQTKKQTTKELVSKFNQSEIEYVCRNMNMNDCNVTKIIEEYYKNIDLWWQRQQDYQHACKLLEIIHRHFEKSEKEINSKLPVIERWNNLTNLDDSSPTQSGIVEIKSDRSRSQQEKLATSKEIKSNVQNVSNIKETVQITKTEDRTKDGKSQITTLQASSTTYNKPNLSSSTIYNKPNLNIQNVKSTVQIAGTGNKVKEEKSKEFTTNSKTTNLQSPSTYNKPNLSTQNVQNVTNKITETGKRVEVKKSKEYEPKFKISNLETYNKPNLSTQNVQNVKTTSKITDAANRVEEEKGKEFGTKFKIPNLEIYNKPNFQKPTIKISETEPSNTAKIITKNELTKPTKTLINYKENKSTDSVKQELTSSLLKIPFKVTPNQNNFPNLSKSQMNTEKPPILKEKPPILTKKPPIQTERPELETEKPQIQTKKPQTQKEKISATKRVIGSRIPTKPTKIEPKTPNDSDKNSRSFSQIRKSYSTTDLKEQIQVTRTKPNPTSSETSLNKLKLIEQIKLKTTNSEKNLNKPKLKDEVRLTKTIQQSFTNTAKNLIKPKLEQIKLTKTSQSTNSETALNKPKMKQTRVPLANNRLKRSSSWLIEKMSAFEMIPSRSYHEKSVKDDKYRETKSMIKKLQIEPEDQPISSNDNTNNLNRFKK